MSLAQRFCVMLMAAVSLTACGSSDGGPADPGDPGGPPQTPRIAISVSTTSLTVQAGGNGSLTATISRSGGFSGAVAIVTTGAPAGVSATESNVATTGVTTTGTITVSVAGSVAAGSYPLTVTASGAGVTSVQAPLTLVVTAAPPAPDFRLTVPSTLALTQAASGTAAVTISRTSFTGAVTLSATGVPAGVTAAFSPVAPTTNSSTLTLQVAAGAAPGSYPIQILGTGSPGTRSDTLVLTIAVAGRYTLSATPNAVTVSPTGSISATVSVIPSGGFAGAVALTVSGLPTGMSAAFVPATTTANSTLTLTTAGAAAGTSTLTITGATAGLSAVSTTLAVTVTPVIAPTTVTVDYAACPLEDRPEWLAYRDGPSAAWVRVTGVANRYTFTLTGALGGLALAGNGSVEVLLERASWFPAYAADVCPFTGAGRTVSGTAIGLPANAEGLVSFGSEADAVSRSFPDFRLTDAPLGTHDLIGYIRAGSGVGTGDRIAIRRDVDPAPPGTVPALDFGGAESFAPQFAGVQVAGTGGQALEFSLALITRSSPTGNRCDIATLYDELPESGTSLAVFGVPDNRLRPGDQHLLRVRASTTTGQTELFQEVLESFHALAPRNMVLPGPFNPSATRVTGSSYHRLRVQGTLPSGIEALAVVSTGRVSDRDIGMLVSADWLSGPSVDISTPDFTGLPGFNASWAPGVSESVEYVIAGVSRQGITGLEQPCLANTRVAGSGKEGILPD